MIRGEAGNRIQQLEQQNRAQKVSGKMQKKKNRKVCVRKKKRKTKKKKMRNMKK